MAARLIAAWNLCLCRDLFFGREWIIFIPLLELAKKFFQAFGVAIHICDVAIIMRAVDFDEKFWAGDRGEIAFAVAEADGFIIAAVEDEHGYLETRKFFQRLVFDAVQPAHGQPREAFLADIRDARERALQHEAAHGFAQSEFGGDGTAQ